MNMGQRYLQLQNTYTVSSNGDITLHVAQVPPNSNLFQPGPAWVYVVVNGIPSNGTSVLVGSGAVGTQPVAAAAVLPASVKLASASGSADAATTKSDPAATTDKKTSTSSNMTIIIAAAAGGAVLLALIGGLIWFCAAKRKREAARTPASKPYGMSGPAGASVGLGAAGALRNSDSSAFTPLHHDGPSHTWNASSASLGGYQDEPSHERDQSFGSGYPQQQSNYPQYGHAQQGSQGSYDQQQYGHAQQGGQGSYDQQQYGHAQQGSYDQYDHAPGGYGQAGGYAQPRAPYGDNMSTRGSTNGMSMDFDPYTAEAMRTTPVRRF
jgi:hypothetical protein